MPIRRASVTTQPNNDARSLLVAVVVIGVVIGLASSGPRRSSSLAPPFQPPAVVYEPVSIPVLDPALLEGLELERPNSRFRVSLEHEVHRSQSSDGRLFATGVIRGGDPHPLDVLHVEVRRRDREGPIRRAVVSCAVLQPGEICAWMIDEELGGTLADLEFIATGRLPPGLVVSHFELRGDQLELDAERGIVSFKTYEASVLDPWASVTAYDAGGQVLGVSKTLWADHLNAGHHRLGVAVPESAEAIERYEVRVGGLLPDW